MFKEVHTMKLKFQVETKNIIWFIVMSIMALVLFLITNYLLPVMICFAGAYFLLKNLQVEVNEKFSVIWNAIIFLGGAVLTTFSIQYMLLEQEDFEKTTTEKLLFNIVCCLAIYLVVQIFTNNGSLTCAVSHILLLVLGFSDYFVYSFRGNELTFADLKSIGTGLSVASKYNFELSSKCSYVILAAVIYVVIAEKIGCAYNNKWIMRLISFLLVVVCGIVVYFNTTECNTETWEKKGTYRNGYVLNFFLEIRDSFVVPPKGYSARAVEELEDKYQEADSSYSKADVKKPTIIVVMNESFADLRLLGNLDTNYPLTPFIDSLKENTTKGYALSSVFGAKTPNSEWEFGTGNSMAFLPEGSVVYQQYIDSKPNSIVSTLKNQDYTCVAMHPYFATGWSRNKIYPTMGFDEMYFMDDFDKNNIMREYITDEEMYNKIIDRFENKKAKENLYIMGITMQNHGGYGDEYMNFPQTIYKYGVSYTDVNQYLQLVNESDKAVKKLIQYFEKVDEPVEIVFFGDHQPGLNNKFYEMMNGKGLSGLNTQELQKLYTVPFFIWTNYDTPAEQVEITSLNYLSTMALERANIDLPAYNQFLADMMEKIPAINARGYYSNMTKCFRHFEDAKGDEAEWLKKYNILQYNNMFGKGKRSEFFFPYLK